MSIHQDVYLRLSIHSAVYLRLDIPEIKLYSLVSTQIGRVLANKLRQIDRAAKVYRLFSTDPGEAAGIRHLRKGDVEWQFYLFTTR